LAYHGEVIVRLIVFLFPGRRSGVIPSECSPWACSLLAWASIFLPVGMSGKGCQWERAGGVMVLPTLLL